MQLTPLLPRTYLFLFSFFFIINLVYSQEKKTSQNFDIVVAGFRIGGMTAEKTDSLNKSKIEINSLVEFWFFGKVHVEFLQTASFLNKQLVGAYTNSNSNRGDFETIVEWSKDHYEVNAETYKYKNTESIYQKVYSSPAKLYFEEPSEGDILISENFGRLTKINEEEPGVYSIDVNGNTNTFYYEMGVLQKVVMENSIKNYVIRRADD